MDINLHPRQFEAYSTSATELLFGGAAGGGKSFWLRVALILWCAAIPGLQCYLFRRTHPDLRKNHMEGPASLPALLANWIANKLAKTNWSDMYVEFWNGSKIFLCHCQYEKDVYNYQGAEIHVLALDELTQFTKPIYSFLRSRVRMTGITLPPQFVGMFPRIIAGSNPGGIGHNWVKAMFIDLAPIGEVWQAPAEDGGMRRQYIRSRISDNPTLQREDPNYIARLEGLGNPALVKAMKDGDWNIVAGGMFDDLWNPDKHIIMPHKIPITWRIDRSFDWGSSKPFAVSWWAETDGTVFEQDGRVIDYPRGSVIKVGEWYGWNGNPNEGQKLLASEIAIGIKEREAIMRKNGLAMIAPGPADSSIFDSENGMCIADDMAAKGVRWTRADKSPGSRKAGAQRIRSMLKASAKRDREEPWLLFWNNTIHTARTLPVLPRSDRDPDDVDSDAEDHDYDTIRYRLQSPKKELVVRKLGGV